MKYIFIILLFLFSNNIYSQDSLNINDKFKFITGNTHSYIKYKVIEDKVIEDKDISLIYDNNFGTISFKSGEIFYYSHVTDDIQIVKCSPMIFEIMYSVNHELNSYYNTYINQLRLKIQFYEKYFGKLIGDMNSDCIQWVPIVKQPEFDHCIEEKKNELLENRN